MKTNNLVILVLLLSVMSIGVVIELQHLYNLPSELINNTESVYNKNNTLLSNGLASFSDYEELENYLSEYKPSSWYVPLKFGITMTMATAVEAKGGEPSYIGGAGEEPSHYSTTNIQVPGVDEADIVKSDGKYLYVIGNKKISIVQVFPLEKARLITQWKTSDKEYPVGLFVQDNTLVLITVKNSEIYHIMETNTITSSIYPPVHPTELTMIYLYNITDRERPQLYAVHNVTGSYITARMINNTIIVVAQEPLYTIYKNLKNTLIIPLIDNEELQASKIYYAPGTSPSSYANILTLNLDDNQLNATSVLMPPIAWVYASQDNIYLFATEWNWGDIPEPKKILEITLKYMDNHTRDIIEKIMETDALSEELKEQLVYQIINEKINQLPLDQYNKLEKEIQEEAVNYIGKYTGPETHVYRIKLQPLGLPEAHTKISGNVLDQFAIDERKGQLRIAVTARIITGIDTYDYFPFVYPITKTVNNVYILNSTSLEKIGELTGLAPGENVYSARYMGDILYLVTFKRVDPLFAINLSNPEKPEVLGYAKMPGYSEYLHPLNNTMLVGIGYDTDEEGRVTGIKVSLYDITDPMNIKEISKLIVSKHGYSQVMYDHKAFLYNPYNNYIAFPLHYWDYENKTSVDNAEIIKIDNNQLKKWLEIPHPMIQRILYVEDNIITLSPDLIKITTGENNTISIPLTK